jgi:hypothetical protein
MHALRNQAMPNPSSDRNLVRKPMARIPIVLIAALLFIVPLAHAQEAMVIPLLNGPIQLDGLSDEPAWEAVAPLAFVMHQPSFGEEPTERTEVRVAHDGQYLYVAGRMYDSDAGGIRGTSLRRDDGSMTNDWIVINLDTFNDGENTAVIGVTPAGVRTDMAYNDVQGSYNFDWNTFWDAEVRRTDEGWFVEMRIPFSSLRFQDHDGRVYMGMSVWRNIARKSELATFPAIRPDWGFDSIVKASELQPIVLHGVHSRKPLYVIPYAIGGAGFTSPLSADGSAFMRNNQMVHDAGVDLKYGITSNLTLDLTYNTDFAQIEADDQQVNLTRFSLFFPEKRQFFQERASIFDFSIGGNDRLFYSRRIGLAQGQSVPLYGGGRLVGRIGAWDVGLLNMQAAAVAGLTSENLGVLRVQRQFLNERSTVGGILTSRQGDAGSIVYALDGLLNIGGQNYLTLNWAQSFSQGEPGDLDVADRSLIRARWERRGIDGFRYAFDVARSGVAFNPALGFQERSDYTSLRERVSYGWRPGRASPLLRYAVLLQGAMFLRNEDRTVESLDIGPQATLSLKSGHTFGLGLITAYEDLRSGFSLAPGVTVPVDRYHFQAISASYSPSQGSLLRTSASVNAGQFFDGWRLTASLSPIWNVSRHFDLTGTYQINRVEFASRGQQLTAHVVRLRSRAALNTRLSGAALVQYNSVANAVFLNARVRYNPREGNDLYLVFNENLVTDRFGFLPERRLTDSRTVMVKYVHTLSVGL